MVGIPYYKIIPCCPELGTQLSNFRIPGGTLASGSYQYIGANTSINGIIFKTGFCYTITNEGTSSGPLPNAPSAVDFSINTGCLDEKCNPCITYYTFNDCCTNEPFRQDGEILVFEYQTGVCEPGACPANMEGLVITALYPECVPPCVPVVEGCFNLTVINTPPVDSTVVDWFVIADFDSVQTCAECQDCSLPVYYTFNDCCTGQPYILNDQILCLVYTGFCELGTCPQDLLPLIITSVSNEGTPDYITGCFNLTQVQSVPPGAFTANYLTAIASVETVPTCADCQECCYTLTNCETDEVIYSNSNTLGQHFGNTVPLNGQEGSWGVGISAGSCDCITVTFTGPGGTDIYTANANGTYNGYNLYEFTLDGDIVYIWSPGDGWIISSNGYGGDPAAVKIADVKFEGDCPDSVNEGFTWDLSEVTFNSIETEICPAECTCPIPVTVLQSFEDCPSCLPIVAYKFTNCNNQILVQYSTEDYSAYVGKTVELECGDCWFVSQIDYTPPSTQTITILYTFDSCIACNRTYYKLTDCLDPTNVTYTYTDLSSVIPPPVIGCDCIKVTYTLVGEEPVTVEVESDGIENGKKSYNINTGGEFPFNLIWSGTQWQIIDFGDDGIYLNSDTECPFGTFIVADESIFEAFSVAPCSSLPVIKIKGCDSCFTVEETREPINAGIVELVDSFIDCPECLVTFPCVCNRITNQNTIAKDFTYLDCLFEEVTINLQPNETSDKVCLINWVLTPEEEALVYIEHFGDCINGQCPVVPFPKRKVKPGYSTPSCDIEKYEKITCKASEIYYKQVMRLRYGISNCCPEEEEKWLIKKELIDLVALIDPDYICTPVTSCCGQTLTSCGCGCNQTLKTCNSQ